VKVIYDDRIEVRLGLWGMPCQCMYISRNVRDIITSVCETGPRLLGDWGTPAPHSGRGEPVAPKMQGRLTSRVACPGSRQTWHGGWGKMLKAGSYGDELMYCE
jgi:hypothetical protein